ncbi:secondary thiamine-phosphate synthase enzyme YjbQ [Aquisalinus flavus]|uniref:Secondary thiamine-phosphate synthase enzyme n=1 Tax=Aquisalinus flavus TaxID=1526572 RepID=A0A8J2V769_9PROT|nr:secondary thiamine-phosphate synthase enzyme YjbQ [Aquisalinus flavus]MBD0427585.1 YjbQ family protein [Aquisalinus flavus]UNE47377.1 YjbQ family protein [Aquisalinus flavus]GGD02167.1 hypothetical protein GCM10011342_08990 [Aquisalinus flavus]
MEDMTRQATGRLSVETRGRSMQDVSRRIDGWLAEHAAGNGLLTVFIRHTSASLTIQENADPDVQTDLLDALSDLAPAGRRWRHDAEGPDDMPAHVKSVLTDVSLSIPVMHGRMDLGTWQGVYVIEHRDHGHNRTLTLCFQGN